VPGAAGTPQSKLSWNTVSTASGTYTSALSHTFGSENPSMV
jgi:hypothetical protein